MIKRIFDWCCFYYFVRNSLVALLEASCARIFFFRFVNISFLLTFFVWCKVSNKAFLPPLQRARASATIDNQRRNSSSNESRWRVQISGILGHKKRRYESNQGGGQAKDHCSTWPDQMPSSHTRASNGIVNEQRYGSLLLLIGPHWVVWTWIERRETIVHPSLQERLALATVNSMCSLYLP